MPFTAAAIFLALLAPVTIPVALILLAHAWIIPELYAARGANVVRRRAAGERPQERRAMLLLGDLISPAAQHLYERTELVMERGRFGVWLLGETGALLVRSGGRRLYCYCVKVTDPDLPAADKTAHLLLALRADEAGFATVANLAFSGAPWRLRRRLPEPAREALAAARAAAAAGSRSPQGEDLPRP